MNFLLKARHFKQPFPKETRTKMTSLESWRFGLTRRSWIRSQMGFFWIVQAFVSIVELRSEVQIIFFDTDFWKLHVGKVYAFQHFETEVWLFSNFVYGLAETRISFVSWVGRCKISFFDANLRKNNMYRQCLLISCNKGWLVFKCGFCLWKNIHIF